MSPCNISINKIMKILWACALLTVEDIYSACDTNAPEQCRTSYLQIGASYTHANIKVDSQSTFEGNLGGLQGSYEYKPWNSFYAGLKLAWKEGKTKNSFANRKLVYIDAQERIGYTYASYCNDWSVTWFSGVGYRYLGHTLTQHEESSIKFDYNEFYVPVGFLSEYFFCGCWSIGLNFTWMPQVYPTVEIKPLKGARWDLKRTIGNVLVELPLTYSLTEEQCYSLILKPFYEHWEDGRSTAKTFSGQKLGLPKNNYNLWGVEINFAFLF